MYTRDVTQQLQRLEPLDHAYYSSGDLCTPGTRVALLERVIQWIKSGDIPQGSGSGDSSEARVFWLHGMAGTGKSTVANTVADMVKKSLRVPLSCFFCRQGDPELSEPKRILPTLASRFAQRHPTYLDAILRVLQSDQDLDVINGTLDEQFKLLFENSLESTADPLQPHVVVVDALDETGSNATSRREIARRLLALAQLAPWIRIFVTSRKNEEINAVLGNNAGCLSADIHKESQKEEDIRRYVTARFADLRRSPSEDIVREIVARADGLFIWCSTVFKTFEHSTNPERDLKKFLQSSSSNSKLSPLYQLYDHVLQSAAPVEADAELLRFLLGAIFVTAGNRPLSALWALIRHDGRFADEDEAGTSVNTLISRLHAVLYEEQDSNRAIRAYHQSFLDFIQYKLEDHNSDWKAQLVDLPAVHLVLATSCLGVMRAELKFNICGIESPMPNRDVPDFEHRVSTRISPQLRYACLFLGDHLSRCPPPYWELIRPSLSDFINGTEFIWWLEVLSAVDGVGRAATILGECIRCLPVRLSGLRARIFALIHSIM